MVLIRLTGHWSDPNHAIIAYLARYSDTHALVKRPSIRESTIISAFIAQIACLLGLGILRAVVGLVALLRCFAYLLK